MTQQNRLFQVLESRSIPHEIVEADPHFTAQEVAEAAHVSGHQLLKTVVLKVDGKILLAVIPACERIDTERVAQLTGASSVELASEAEFAEYFPDCELGAMPPFGPLYGIPELIDESCLDCANVTFLAGTHGRLVQMRSSIFENMLRPEALVVCIH